MKTPIRNLVIMGLAAALPLAVSAQSSTGSSSTGSQSSDTTSSTRPNSSGSSTYDSTSTGSHTAGMGGLQRVTKDSLDSQLTAKDLIGKDVYDNAGKKVGSIDDVVLSSAASSHLATAFSSKDRDQSDSSYQTASGNTGAASGSANNSGNTYGSTSGSNANTSSTGSDGIATRSSSGNYAASNATGSTDSTSTSGSMNSSTRGTQSALGSVGSAIDSTMSSLTSEPAAIVSVGGFMGMGRNMVRVPVSQLSFDASNERLTINVSESELAALTENSDTGRSAAE